MTVNKKLGKIRGVRSLIFLISLFTGFSSCAEAKLRVAVIDSGFGSMDQIDYTSGKFKNSQKLCEEGHRDFTGHKLVNSVPVDGSSVKHGTNIVGVIDQNSATPDFCVIVIKYYHEGISGEAAVRASVRSIRYANEMGADVINYSGGGTEPNEEEKVEVKKFLDRGGVFVAAAGNNHNQIGSKYNTYYPAMYDPRIIVVGNKTAKGNRSPSSNYGPPVNHWEVGENIEGYGIKLTGTSQATAVTTGKMLYKLAKGTK